jgi:hypothetical protein
MLPVKQQKNSLSSTKLASSKAFGGSERKSQNSELGDDFGSYDEFMSERKGRKLHNP